MDEAYASCRTGPTETRGRSGLIKGQYVFEGAMIVNTRHINVEYMVYWAST